MISLFSSGSGSKTSVPRVLLLIFIGLILAAYAHGQVRHTFFYGKVLDQAKKYPLPNVNVMIRGTTIGTTTDRKGEFTLYSDTVPCYLVVSCLGYQTKTVYLDGKNYGMTLYLNHAVTELAEVEIVANAQETVFKDVRYAVRDYEVDSGMIYMIIYRLNVMNFELACKAVNGDTLAHSKRFHFLPSGLFHDCLGYVHVLGSDSCYQVYRDRDSLKLIYSVPRKKFDDVLLNCVASTDKVLFYKNLLQKGLIVEYYGIDRKTFQRVNLSSVSDEKQQKMLRRNPNDLKMLYGGIPDDRETFNNWNFLNKIIYKPVKTALYRINDYICILDMPDHVIDFYDLQGNYSYKLELKTETVQAGRWNGDFMLDETSGKVYTTYQHNGSFILFRIDLNDGSLHKQLTLAYLYPEKIRVYDGFVYFLYDIPGSPDNKALYRQRL